MIGTRCQIPRHLLFYSMILVFVNQCLRQRASFVLGNNSWICAVGRRYGFMINHDRYSDGISCRSQSTNNSCSSHLFFEDRKIKFIKRMEKLASRQPVLPKKKSLAGVLIPFCIAEGKPSVLLTKRSHKLTRNKGDVSFPGGKMDAADKDIIDTTLRETNEEIGLPRSDIEIWTCFKPMYIRDPHMNVVPMIGFIPNFEMSKLSIDSNEVSSVFTVSIEDLCDPANQAYTKYRNGVTMPLFIKQPYKIWGFTAIILDFILANFLPDIYSLKWKEVIKKRSGIQYL